MLPELETLRRQSVATPVARTRNVATLELIVERLHSLFEFFTTRDHGALSTRVRTELTSLVREWRSTRRTRPLTFARRHLRCVPVDRALRSTRAPRRKDSRRAHDPFVIRSSCTNQRCDRRRNEAAPSGCSVFRRVSRSRPRRRRALSSTVSPRRTIDGTGRTDSGQRSTRPTESTRYSRDVRQLPVRERREIHRTRPVVTKAVGADRPDHRGVVGAHRHGREMCHDAELAGQLTHADAKRRVGRDATGEGEPSDGVSARARFGVCAAVARPRRPERRPRRRRRADRVASRSLERRRS